ncbi:HD-GYP domain-containing protein [Cohnella candidum]|uniref:HD-GYP domain-containing protein n=1 Tax=Cohnella candidum TaxID=2674991 RepID=UPI0013DE70F9|nr:HD domain-containing phosphohydrolase [Cohnella candidum]
MNISRFIDRGEQWALQLRQYFMEHFTLAVLLFIVVCVLCLAGFWIGMTRGKQYRKDLQKVTELLGNLDVSKGLEKNLTIFLEMASEFVLARTYTFYVKDAKNGCYVLKAVRHQSVDFGKVKPSYSGLTGYQKESYQPPVTLPLDALPRRTGIVKEGEVPLLSIPLKSGTGVIRIAPLRSASAKAKRGLSAFATYLEKLVDMLMESEMLKMQAEISHHSVQALKTISDVTSDHKTTVSIMLETFLRATSGRSAVFLLEKLGFRQVQTAGLSANAAIKLQSVLSYNGFALPRGQEAIVVSRGEPDFIQLPSEFTENEVQSVVGVQLQTSIGTAMLLVGYEEKMNKEQLVRFGIDQLITVIKSMTTVLESQEPLRQLSSAHIQLFHSLARMLDDSSPYTVGYSEQMNRYSVVIAQQLGMEEDEIRDVGLAAYLSHIGVIGISNDLYQKEGKYTEIEFEKMKLHAEVGALMVGVTIGNPRVAEYIMHHHERMDGFGYPKGLKGEEIPLGARIIAVVQTFLAKINGRKSRDPLRFDQALHTLTAAAGTQLDPQVVTAFIQWFREKQKSPEVRGRSLGTCWEMCCTPESICEKCPAYHVPEVNCWEVEGNLCRNHGKSCDTCFVKTEYLTREYGNSAS